MNSAYGVLLALAAVIGDTAAAPQYYNASHKFNIATVISVSETQDQANSSSTLDEDFIDRLDLILVGNDSISSTWLDDVAGFAVAADSKVLYQTAVWSLIEDGSQQDNFLSSWARFQSVNSTVMSMSVCAMVVEWDNSWSGNKAVLAAVEVEERLTEKCVANDTVAVAFTSAVSETVDNYLKGKIAVNDAVASFKMHDAGSSHFPGASDRLFIHVADGICPLDESAKRLSAANEAEEPLFSLFRGEVCVNNGVKSPQTPSASLDGFGSDWQPDLRFVIPIGLCVFVVGSAGLIYLLRWKKHLATAEIDTPKEEKDDPSSLPYVLTVRPV